MKQRVMLDALWHIGKVKPRTVLAPIFLDPSVACSLAARDVAKKGGVLVGFHEKSQLRSRHN